MRPVSRTLPVSADTAWRLLTDTRAWPEWGPSVSAVECPGRYIEAGMEGRVRTPAGPWIPFLITEFDPQRRYWAWRVAGVPATGHRVTPVDADHCEVAFLVPRWAPFYARICEIALDRIEAAAGGG